MVEGREERARLGGFKCLLVLEVRCCYDRDLPKNKQ